MAGAAARYLVPREVDLTPLRADVFHPELIAPGLLDANIRAEVSTSLPGRIIALYVERNDTVRAGDPVASIDTAEAEAQFRSASAALVAARRATDAARAELSRAETSHADAKATLERQEGLRAAGLISQATLDSAVTAERNAGADLDRVRSLLQESLAQMLAAEASSDAAKAMLERGRVLAPIGGVVIRRDLGLGDYALSTTPIIGIVDPASIILAARFDESALGLLQAGMPARAVFGPAGSPDSITGHILRITREVDSETREFIAEIVLDALPRNWAIDQRATVTIALASISDAVTVAPEVLAWRDGTPGLWVVENSRARWREVRLGAVGGGRVEISGGPAAGAMILRDPSVAFFLMRVSGQ